MKRVVVTYEDGFEEVHFVIGNSDAGICGCDILGDDSSMSEHGNCGDGVVTRHKFVNCTDCLFLVRACKRVYLRKHEKEK